MDDAKLQDMHGMFFVSLVSRNIENVQKSQHVFFLSLSPKSSKSSIVAPDVGSLFLPRG
jgi:hypothetical protein